MRARDLLTCLLCSSALGSEPDGWEFTGAAGLSYSDGNSDSAAYSVQALASYVDDDHEAYIGADWFYAENGGIQSTDSFQFSGSYNRTLSGKWYAGGLATFYRDDVAAIDYRVDTGILLGYRVLDGDRTKLSFEAGPGYGWEEKGGTRSDFATLRIGQRFEYEFTEVTRLWQSLGWTPQIGDFSEYLLEFELGLETRITESWSLRTFLRHRIDGSPAPGSGKNDTALMVGVAYDFSGLPEPEDSSSGRRSLMPGEDEGDDDAEGWSATGAFGFTLNKGNSDSLGAQLAWNQAYTGDVNEFFFDLTHIFSEDNGSTSTDRTTARIQFNRFFGDRFYLGGALPYLRDSPADIDYRLTPAFLAGYKLIKTDRSTLAFEGGPSYTFEKVGRNSDNYASVFVAERFSYDFNSRISFKQSAAYNAELSDFDRFNLILSAAIDTTLSDRFIWRLGVDYSYENQPAVLRDHHDTTMVSSIAVKF